MPKIKGKKKTNNDLQNITQKTKDQATRTPLKTGVTSGDHQGWLFYKVIFVPY